MEKKEKFIPTKKMLIRILQFILNASLTLLALILVFLMIIELKDLMMFLVLGHDAKFSVFLEKILIFFLYFEFIALIVKYFKENYHFPLRYFMYIGITAMIRVIIVDHENSKDTLLFSLTILVLVIGYVIIKKVSTNRGID